MCMKRRRVEELSNLDVWKQMAFFPFAHNQSLPFFGGMYCTRCEFCPVFSSQKLLVFVCARLLLRFPSPALSVDCYSWLVKQPRAAQRVRYIRPEWRTAKWGISRGRRKKRSLNFRTSLSVLDCSQPTINQKSFQLWLESRVATTLPTLLISCQS